MTEQRISRYMAALRFAQSQVTQIIDQHHGFFPIYTTNGKWFHQGELWTDWTGGFFAGQMWHFYRITNDDCWKECAEYYSDLLEHRRHDRNVHDLGFIFLNTFLPAYEITGDEAKKEVVIEAGRTLSLRFQEKGRYLCSFIAPESLFIDIMMNVPIIFYAANETGDEKLKKVAVDHCRRTRDTIVRHDGSTAHEGIFNTETGEFIRESTHQGLRADSAWARGLAWSLYGYSKVYALTGMDEFLDVSERNADYWLSHLPDDKVPYWDFDADLTEPLPWGPQKDSSAGAIAASGLLDLAEQTKSADKRISYRQTALDMLDALVKPEYLAEGVPGWEGTLRQGVYHTKKNLGVDESVMWGDFFFVEALSKVVLREGD